MPTKGSSLWLDRGSMNSPARPNSTIAVDSSLSFQACDKTSCDSTVLTSGKKAPIPFRTRDESDAESVSWRLMRSDRPSLEGMTIKRQKGRFGGDGIVEYLPAATGALP